MEIRITSWQRFKADWEALRGFINEMNHADLMDLVRAVDKAIMVIEAEGKAKR